MPNIAALLKSEISRVARKELRAETQSLKKATTAHRSEIAALKRRTQSLEQLVRRLAKGGAASQRETSAAPEPDGPVGRFSAKGLISQRRRLALSAADCGLLLGASAQSVYNWEEGKVRPRVKHLAAIAELRGLGKKAVAARLDAFKGTA